MPASEQLPIFDSDRAAAARDEGHALVLANRQQEAEMVSAAIETVARRYPEFSSDEVWTELIRRGVMTFTQPNVIGAAFRRAALAHIIHDTGRVRKSDRVAAHSRKVQIWRSEVWRR